MFKLRPRLRLLHGLLIICVSYSPGIFASDACACGKALEIREQHAYYFNTGDLDSAVWSAQRLLQPRTTICRIFYHNWMSQTELARNDLAAARKHFDAEFALLKQLDCADRLSRHYTNFSLYFQYSGDLDSAVFFSLKALELSESTGSTEEQIRICSNLAAFFNQLKQSDKELAYERQAVSIARSTGNTEALTMTLPRLTSVLLNEAGERKDAALLDSIFLFASESMTLSTVSENPFYLLESYHNLSRYYEIQHDPSRVLRYADSMLLTIPPGVDIFYRYTSNAFLQKAYAYQAQQQQEAARIMADSALRYAEMFNIQTTGTPLELIYKTSKALGDPVRALQAFERLNKLHDSLFTLEKNAIINELEQKYNQAKNEQTIRELTQQKQIYILLALAAFLALAALGFYLRQQTLRHRQTILETEQRLNRARMNPHFFFNALASLQAYALRENDGRQIASNLSKFSHIMRETLESTYKDYVTVDQECGFLREYLELQQIRFPQRFTFSISTDSELDADECLVPSMIIQPFAENCIEHGFAGISYPGHLSIHFSGRGGLLHIWIKDNGQGLPNSARESSQHISRASQIIRDRIYLLNIRLKTQASFSIENDPSGIGVNAHIRLPLLYTDPQDG